MLIPSVCIEMFWPETPFAERIPKVAALGYSAFEFWGWGNKDLDAVAKAAQENNLTVSACCVNTSYPDAPFLTGEGQAPFLAAVRDCVAVGEKLGCQRFIVTTGNELSDRPRSAQHGACVAALKAASPIAEDAGITLVLEPLNLLVDHRGYYLSTSAEGFEILKEVDSPAVKLLFDIYHQQITEGNLTLNIENNLGAIGHFHVANHPGRIEPARGEIDYGFLFERIAAAGYDGYAGFEFKPSDPARTEAILEATRELVEEACERGGALR